MIFKKYKAKNNKRDLKNEQLARELHKEIEPFNSSIKTPDSLLPENIVKLIKNSSLIKQPEKLKVCNQKIITREKIIAMAAALAVIISSVAVSNMLSDNSIKIIEDKEASSSSDSSIVTEQNDNLNTSSGYSSFNPIENSSENIMNENSVGMLPEINRPQSVVYRIPASAYYLDSNNLVFAPKNNDYSTIISRLNYMREIVYHDYVITSLSNNYQNTTSQTEDQIRYDNTTAKEDENIKSLTSSDYNYDSNLSYIGDGSDNDKNGDIIKSDGDYIYTLSKLNKTLTIIDCKNSQMKILSQMSFKQNDILSLLKIYISGNRLILTYIQSLNGLISTVAKFYNISDRSSPKLERTFSQEGACSSSNLANGNLYIITSREVGNIYGYNEDNYELFIPATTDSNFNNGTRTTVPADRINIINANNSTNYIVVSSINISNNESPAYTYSVLSNNGYIYQTDSSFYIVNSDYNNSSLVFKFFLSDTIAFQATAIVNGYTVNLSSISEYNEYFRIVTTKNKSSNVYIFDKALNKIGAIENISPDETLKSSEFFENTAYLLTDSKTIPLKVIDISKPSRPTIKASLQNSEFSEYMYKINETYIIGIGYNKNENGANQGLKVVLYDYSDYGNPVSVYSQVFGDSGSFSSVFLSDEGYKNFIYDSETQTFSIPMTLTGENRTVQFSGVCVFKLDINSDEKFIEMGKITTWFPCDNNSGAFIAINGDTCSARAVYIESRIFLSSNNVIISANVNNFDNNCSQLLGKKSTIISTLENESYKSFINNELIASPGLIGINYSSEKHKIVIN